MSIAGKKNIYMLLEINSWGYGWSQTLPWELQSQNTSTLHSNLNKYTNNDDICYPW